MDTNTRQNQGLQAQVQECSYAVVTEDCVCWYRFSVLMVTRMEENTDGISCKTLIPLEGSTAVRRL